MSEDVEAEKKSSVSSVSKFYAADDVLERRLDAVEVLQMTLEDVESYQSENPSSNDISSIMARIEMCYRFLEGAPWLDKTGVIENAGLKLLDIHMRLSDSVRKPIGTGCFAAEDWINIATVLTSVDSPELPMQFSSLLLERDLDIIKLMISDRIGKLIHVGPLDFSNRSTMQLLERIELSRRILDDDDPDTDTLKTISNDILHLLNLHNCYEVMEFWETIDFSKWGMKSENVSQETINERKVYSTSDIKEEKLSFEKRWRKILADKSTQYVSSIAPIMMKCYPDHPYLSYAKNNQIKKLPLLQRNERFMGHSRSDKLKITLAVKSQERKYQRNVELME